jgi:hypothetical protein
MDADDTLHDPPGSPPDAENWLAFEPGSVEKPND